MERCNKSFKLILLDELQKLRLACTGYLSDDDVNCAIAKATHILNRRVSTATKERPSTLFHTKLTKGEVESIEETHILRHSRMKSFAALRYGIVGVDFEHTTRSMLLPPCNDAFEFEVYWYMCIFNYV